jgi:DNA repair protein RecO (recombination protein O)
MCTEHKRLASSEISAESRNVAAQMLRLPLSQLQVPQKPVSDLSKFILQSLERHIEKKLVTRTMLERLRR